MGKAGQYWHMLIVLREDSTVLDYVDRAESTVLEYADSAAGQPAQYYHMVRVIGGRSAV